MKSLQMQRKILKNIKKSWVGLLRIDSFLPRLADDFIVDSLIYIDFVVFI